MVNSRKKELMEFEDAAGISFNNIELLDTALTHSSYANQMGMKYNDHNERLEFLGDSVLSMVISEHLYKKYKSRPEGKLTRIRAAIVCEGTLAETARKICLNNYLLIGRGEEMSNGREKDSLLADAMEAVIAAVYLDGGYDTAKKFIITLLNDKIEKMGKIKSLNDYKSKLQEFVQKTSDLQLSYELIEEAGPPHDRTFKMKVKLGDKEYGEGLGKSKKESEQNAAKEALKKLGVAKNEK